MHNSYRGVGFIDVLTACTRSAVSIDAQIRWIDLNIRCLFGLSQNRDGCGGSVNSALTFGFGHALNAMRATFEFQLRINLTPFDLADYPPFSLGFSEILLIRQPCFSANLPYIRAKSPAKIAASSPPVPARISKNTAVALSSGFFGMRSSCNSCSQSWILLFKFFSSSLTYSLRSGSYTNSFKSRCSFCNCSNF